MKVCISCRKAKSSESFSKNRARPDGLNQRCKPCDGKRNRDRRLAAPEVHRQYVRTWVQRNPEHSARHDADSRWRRLEKKFGITRERYEEMLEAQGGCCAICLGGPRGRKKYLSVDHDHLTGVIRGLLCDPCNRALGLIGDDTERLERAVSYLRYCPYCVDDKETARHEDARREYGSLVGHPGWTALQSREALA